MSGKPTLLVWVLLSLPSTIGQFGTIKIDWKQGNGFATPTIDLNPTVDERVDDEPPSADIHGEFPSADIDIEGEHQAASIHSLRRLIISLGGTVGRGADDAALRATAHALISKAKTSTLRKLVQERGRQCVGCAERQDYVDVILEAIDAPIVAMSGLPLFLQTSPLYPHTSRQFHFFEGRYKLLVERALLGDHAFGVVATGGVGTLAHIEAWQILDDGRSLVSVRGGTRFTVTRRWSEECKGCDSGPLHHADVRFFNDTQRHEEEDPRAVAAAATCNRLYHTLTSRADRDGLEQALGPQPSVTRNGSYATSMWLSAACASYPPCAGEAEALLKGHDAAERLERIIAVQRAALRGPASSAAATVAAASKRAEAMRDALRGVKLRVGRAVLGGRAPDQPAAWHGKLLLLHPDAARLGRVAQLTLLAHEPEATSSLRGIDLLTAAGVSVGDAPRPEFRDDFKPHLIDLPAFHGGGDKEGRCGFLALSTLGGLPHSRSLLGGALQLTDLQLDYAPGGSGPALRAIKRALGSSKPPAVKVLMGCRAWPELSDLEEQLDMGLWRLVDVAEGATELAVALVQAQEQSSGEALALWEALWRMSEEAVKW